MDNLVDCPCGRGKMVAYGFQCIDCYEDDEFDDQTGNFETQKTEKKKVDTIIKSVTIESTDDNLICKLIDFLSNIAANPGSTTITIKN